MSVDSVETVVVGAGVVGLAVARALAIAGHEVLVLEANSGIGQETSSRNSEVIHAGIYYQPGSLKARTCIRGKQLLYDYCETRGIGHQRIGKVIVASKPQQFEALEQLYENATSCGVHDLQRLDRQALANIEPAVRGCAALFSPATGIIDSHALMLSLQADLENAGGQVVVRSRVDGGRMAGDGFRLWLNDDRGNELHTRQLVNSAGLHASTLARKIMGFPRQHIPELALMKGHYFTHAGKSPFSHLVYPLPEPLFLGIHATHDLAGQLRFGPDAEFCEAIDYHFEGQRKKQFITAIRQWYPALDGNQLQEGYTGIRPQLVNNGRDFDDFIISGPVTHGISGMVNLFGIESPGLTACLALAEAVNSIFAGRHKHP